MSDSDFLQNTPGYRQLRSAGKRLHRILGSRDDLLFTAISRLSGADGAAAIGFDPTGTDRSETDLQALLVALAARPSGHPSAELFPFLDPYASNYSKGGAATSSTSLVISRNGEALLTSGITDSSSGLGDDAGGRHFRQTTAALDNQYVRLEGPATNAGLLPTANPFVVWKGGVGRITDCKGGVGLGQYTASVAFNSASADPSRRHFGFHWNTTRFGDDNIRLIRSATSGGAGSQKVIDTEISLSELLAPNYCYLASYYTGPGVARASILDATGTELWNSGDVTTDLPDPASEISWAMSHGNSGSAVAIDAYTNWVAYGCNPLGVNV
jgi:hypothetical protein